MKKNKRQVYHYNRFRKYGFPLFLLLLLTIGIGYSAFSIQLGINGSVDVKGVLTVTFDADGGELSTQTKLVHPNGTYGSLPTSTKEHYIFMGWNGKNLFDKNNLDSGHYIGKNTGEVESEEGEDCLDDWESTKLIPVKPNTTYIKTGTNGAQYTVFYDENKESISYGPYPTGTAFTTPANCYYIKYNLQRAMAPYDDVQLLEGDQITPYEPYIITDTTTVVQNTNHTLTAVWKDDVPPTLHLRKETCVQQDLSTWTYSKTCSYDPVEDAMSVDNYPCVISPLIRVYGGFWYPVMDLYFDETIVNKTYGGVFWVTHYYDINQEQTTNPYGNDNNGWAVGNAQLGVWNTDLEWLKGEYSENPVATGSRRYGPDIEYVTLKFRYQQSYSSPITKVRNLRICGESIPNDYYYIRIRVVDNEEVNEVKFASGEQTVEYFHNNGTVVSGKKAYVPSNGVYTVYVSDVSGNELVDTIEITDITS